MRHRSIQRTLFRMQCDPVYARAVFAGGSDAVAHLTDEEAALLRSADPRAVAADRGGRRKEQVLGNVLKEFRLSAASAPEAARRRGFPSGFLASEDFHQALLADGRLPLAFARYAERTAADCGCPVFKSLTALDAEMARLRRAEVGEPVSLARGEVMLSPRARLLDLPAGVLGFADAVRAAVDARAAAPETPDELGPAGKVALLVTRVGDWRLGDVTAEELQPAVAGLLELAQAPLSESVRLGYGAELGADAAAVQAITQSLVADGLLIAG